MEDLFYDDLSNSCLGCSAEIERQQGNEETFVCVWATSISHRDRMKRVFRPAAQQICLFCTVWHQTQQTAECLLLLVVRPLK